MITFVKEHEPGKVIDFQLKDHFEYKYHDYLRFVCNDIMSKYDMHAWYNPPECLMEGSLAYGLKLIHWHQVYHHIKKNRKDGIAMKELWNTVQKIG